MKTRVLATAAVGVVALGFATPVGAQTYVNQQVPVVGSSDSGAAGGVLGASGTRAGLQAQTAQQGSAGVGRQSAESGLAFTGGDIAGLMLIGVALAGTGTVVVRLTRRPQLPTTDA